MNLTLSERERIAYITGHPCAPLLARLDDAEEFEAKVEKVVSDAAFELPSTSSRWDLLADIEQLIELLSSNMNDRVEGLLLSIRDAATRIDCEVDAAEEEIHKLG